MTADRSADTVDVLTGTSGFSYTAWRGTFYPEKLKPADMLAHYAQKLRAVEINNTFYRMPKAEVLEKWAQTVPAGFRFVLKASQRITHRSRLKESGDDSVRYLLEISDRLGDHRGPFLLQLPPNMKADHERLARFLGVWPQGVPAAWEFRHPSWFEGDATTQLLGDHGHALCIADSGGEADAPRVATADFGYLRLRREDYGEDDLADWASWVAQQEWHSAYVFFKHEDAGAGPRMAGEFETLCQR